MSERVGEGLEPQLVAFTDRELAETELAARNAHLRNIEFIPLDEVARRVPAYTTAKRDAHQVLLGSLIYNTDAKVLQLFDGRAWKNLAFEAPEPPPETVTATVKR